jgi:small subunit ribosomal protein S6
MAKQRKHLYEGMYILSASLSEEARQKAFEKITNGIIERAGEIHKMFDQGRKKLAYEINGRREGHYIILYFSALTKSLAEMWKEYHLNEDLIRYITLRTPVVPEKIEFKQLLQE